jgi:uncharacterized membrane protein
MAQTVAMQQPQRRDPKGRLVAPGLLLGMGLGGFVDGILLHQILQWHHMLSSTDDNPMTTVEGLEANMLADGLFHAVTWALAVCGLALLWGLTRRYDVRDFGRSLFGWALAGWGVFNLVEGIVNHHILQIHHVRTGDNEILYDALFLVLGAILLIGGIALGRSTRGRHV